MRLLLVMFLCLAAPFSGKAITVFVDAAAAVDSADPSDDVTFERKTEVLADEHEAIAALMREMLLFSAATYAPARKREVARMTSLQSSEIVSLSLSPRISTLGLPSKDGEEIVSYNQWLASSVVAAPEASAMKVTSLSLKVDAVGLNINTFVAITASTSRRPDLNQVIAVMDTSALDSLTLNTVLSIDLAPVEGSGTGILLPDQEYWVVFGITAPDHEEALASGLYHWSYTESTGPYETIPSWSVGSLVATGNTEGQNWVSTALTPMSFGLSLTPIPESSTVLLLLMSLSVILNARRRSS